MFKVGELTLPSYMDRHQRYFPIEADGTVSLHGWTQFPAAKRHTRNLGMGLLDNREGVILFQPDPVERITRLQSTAAYHDKQANQARTLCGKIRGVTPDIDAKLQARDFADAHADGMHDELPREGCPECES